MTALYHIDPYAKEVTTELMSAFLEDDGRFCVAFQDSLFYPQGGGQKGDRGSIINEHGEYLVLDTIKDKFSSDGRALCILAEPTQSLQSGQKVTVRIDWQLRYSQMRLHSLVHIHHCMMERTLGAKIPNPTTSDLNREGTALNRYETELVTEAMAQAAVQDTIDLIRDGAVITTEDDAEKPGYRYWRCLEFVIPCGGTHLRNISEIGDFFAIVSKKKGRVKVDFALK